VIPHTAYLRLYNVGACEKATGHVGSGIAWQCNGCGLARQAQRIEDREQLAGREGRSGWHLLPCADAPSGVLFAAYLR